MKRTAQIGLSLIILLVLVLLAVTTLASNALATPPTISSATIVADNSYITVNFSEGVFTGAGESGDLIAGDFELTLAQNGGTASVVTINSEASSSGVEKVTNDQYKIHLTLTGTPEGVETITIAPKTATSIYDADDNSMADTESRTVTLKDETAPKVKTNGWLFQHDDDSGAVVARAVKPADVIYVEVTFSEDMDPTTVPKLAASGGHTLAATDMAQVGANAAKWSQVITIASGGGDAGITVKIKKKKQ